MTLPYRWDAQGTVWKHDGPEVGDLFPYEHRVYRVTLVHDRREVGVDDDPQPVKMRALPVEIDPDDKDAKDHERTFKGPAEARWRWQVYPDEHYPSCAKCREPLPCREQMAERIAEASAKRFDRYTTAGVCPSCQEPVTQRQKSLTWEDNVVVPGGPPVTFHQRRACKYDAREYEKRWVAADPERRRTVLSCTGHVTTHSDGTYSCTQMAECPGPTAQHPSYSTCSCPWHQRVHCVPREGARRIDL